MMGNLLIKCFIAFIIGYFIARQMVNGFNVGGPYAGKYNQTCNNSLLNDSGAKCVGDATLAYSRHDYSYHCSCQVADGSINSVPIDGNCVGCLNRCGTVMPSTTIHGAEDILIEGTCPLNAPVCTKGSYVPPTPCATGPCSSSVPLQPTSYNLGTAYCTPSYLKEYDPVNPFVADPCSTKTDEDTCIGSYYKHYGTDAAYYCQWQKDSGNPADPDKHICESGGSAVPDSKFNNTPDKFNDNKIYVDADPYPYFCDPTTNKCLKNTVPNKGPKYNDSGNLYPDINSCKKGCGANPACTNILNKLCGSTSSSTDCNTCVGNNQFAVESEHCTDLEINAFCNKQSS